MKGLLKQVFQGKAQPQYVLWGGIIISVILSIVIFALFYFVDISQSLKAGIESLRYISVLALGWCLLKNRNNASTTLLGNIYGLIALILMISSLYTLVQLFSDKPNVTRATSLGSVSEIIKEVKEEQKQDRMKNAERMQHEYYDVCRRKADWGKPELEGYTQEALNKYEQQYDNLYDVCIQRFDDQKAKCIKGFNQLYYDQGLDPDLYDNIRVEEVKKCMDGKPYN